MAKIKKPAPKGGKKAAAPKKVAKKKPSKIIAAVAETRAGMKRARQIDQFNADMMRADSAIAAGKAATDKVLAQLEAAVAAAGVFGAAMSKPLHPTVEEQFEAEAPKPGFWSRFRSAVTGLFVPKAVAEANPDTTVREKVRK